MDLLKAGLTIGYPGNYGLPEWEPAMVLIYDKEDVLQKEEPNTDFINFDSATLWCAGKEYERHKVLSEYVGKNEKTKIVNYKFTFILKYTLSIIIFILLTFIYIDL